MNKVKIPVGITEDNLDWLNSQGKNITRTVNELIQAMRAESPEEDDDDNCTTRK